MGRVLSSPSLLSCAKEFECSKRGTRRYPDEKRFGFSLSGWIIRGDATFRLQRCGSSCVNTTSHRAASFRFDHCTFCPKSNTVSFLSWRQEGSNFRFEGEGGRRNGTRMECFYAGKERDEGEKKGISKCNFKLDEIRNCASLLPVYYAFLLLLFLLF